MQKFLMILDPRNTLISDYPMYYTLDIDTLDPTIKQLVEENNLALQKEELFLTMGQLKFQRFILNSLARVL